MKTRPNLLIAAGVFALALIAAVFVAPLVGNAPAARAETAKSITPDADTSNIRVIDGDTLEDMSADITYRLVNTDTPETGSAPAAPPSANLAIAPRAPPAHSSPTLAPSKLAPPDALIATAAPSPMSALTGATSAKP